MTLPRPSQDQFAISLAIVSGKGGSGKTLVATAIAEAFAIAGKRVLLVDADLGTGGLSYYLGFNVFGRLGEGLSEFISADVENRPQVRVADPRLKIERRYPHFENISLLPIGRHRMLDGDQTALDSEKILALLRSVGMSFDFVIFDCRGGIDKDSLEVCKVCTDVLIVVETDAASIQASQHLLDVLSKAGLSKKVLGFMLNKVLDNPRALADASRTLFQTEYLGSVPFDIDTTRAFIKGDVPDPSGLFCRHVFFNLSKIYRLPSSFEDILVLADEEFGTVTLREPDLARGQTIVAMSLFILIISFSVVNYSSISFSLLLHYYEVSLLVFSLLVISIVSLSDRMKKLLGGLVRSYVDAVRSYWTASKQRRERKRSKANNT